MPSFAYTALTNTGGTTQGLCQSTDAPNAAATLRASNLFVLELREVASAPKAKARTAFNWRRMFASLKPLTSQHIIQFFRQMGLMLRSGLPLLQAFSVYQVNASHPRLADLAGRIAGRIQTGSSFSVALAGENRIFPAMVAKMVAAGEATGELDTLLERIGDQLENRADLQQNLLTSLMYPSLVIVITIGVVIFLITGVIPKFVHMLSTRNIELPPSTQLLVNVSNFFNANWMQLILGFGSALIAFFIVYATRFGKYWTHRLLLAAPIVGNILTLAFMAHFGRTLAILLKSGIPALEGLGLLCESVGNPVFVRHLRRAELELLGGATLSKTLRTRVIPSILPELISVGEATGTLERVLDELGVYHEKKLQRTLKWLSTLFEPAMILIVGGIVGFVYISFFQCLYQIAAH